MTTQEFVDLRPLHGRRVRIKFYDEQEVAARLISATVDLDGSSHLIYDTVEWSALPHLLNGEGVSTRLVNT